MILTPCRLYIACTVLFSLKITYRKRRNYDEEEFLRRYANAALERLRVRVPAADPSEWQTGQLDKQQVQTQYTQYIDQHHHAPLMGEFIFPSKETRSWV